MLWCLPVPLAVIALALPPLAGAISLAIPPTLTDSAPSWVHLKERVLATKTGERLRQEIDQRAVGRGPPHADASLRLFDAESEADVCVTLYRDDAGWCPYCQKVWLLLEEKRVPYRMQRGVPLNAYGDKPVWFTRMVDGGKLPALDLNGELHTESMEIMKVIDSAFPDHPPRMVPPDGTAEAALADRLFGLERKLQSAWFSLTFYPVEGEALFAARSELLEQISLVDEALGKTAGPWFLGGDHPALIDLQYISHVERMVASVLYWKGITIRGGFPNLDRWLTAFEERPCYLATKSDYFTLVKSMPSQNGPGYGIAEARKFSYHIDGLDGAWEIPLRWNIEPLALLQSDRGVKAACHEAAFHLVHNRDKITTFACRGAGEPGRPSYHAELADPCAESNEDFFVSVDVCLRHVVTALLEGIHLTEDAARYDLAGNGGNGELRPSWGTYEDKNRCIYYWNEETGDVAYTPPTMQLDTCLAYLRDRVGVPRDMGHAAAMQLRAHLNWAIATLK